MSSRPWQRIILMVAAVAMIGGCRTDKQTEPGSPTDSLVLYCGAGIRPPVVELIDAFTEKYGIEVAPDFAGSEVLLSRIELNRQGDLYMPGDAYYVDQAADSNLVASRQSVGYWIPTILVQKGNPKQINSLNDLLRDGVKVGLGDPNVCAIGRTTKMLLQKNSIQWSHMDKTLAYKSLTVNELGLQIQARSLDAVIVWDAMARYFAKWGDQVPIPTADNIISSIDIAVLTCSTDQQAAGKFVDFLTSPEGREIFARHRYTTERPQD